MWLIQEITDDLPRGTELQYQVQAVMALQEASKIYIVGYMHDTNLCAIHMRCMKGPTENWHLPSHMPNYVCVLRNTIVYRFLKRKIFLLNVHSTF